MTTVTINSIPAQIQPATCFIILFEAAYFIWTNTCLLAYSIVEYTQHMETESQISAPSFPETVQQKHKKFPFPKFLHWLLTSLLLISTLYFAYRIMQLQKQILQAKNLIVTANKGFSDLTYADLNDQIKTRGSISGAKTADTDKWTSTSDVITKKIKFSYQYPAGLFAVPDLNGETNSLYFFENRNAYKKYLSCTPGQSAAMKNGCNSQDNLLFYVWVGTEDPAYFSGYKPSDLVTYMGPTDDLTWTVPKEKSMIGGYNGNEMYAEGKTKSGDMIMVRFSYETATASGIGLIKKLSTLDIYPFFIHILSTFKSIK
jgi:hypothetical protein